MPFELGVFYGAKQLGLLKHQKKECIIFEKEKYRYQQFLSDIAGIDVSPHDNNPHVLMLAVREWLATASRRTSIPQGTDIVNRYISFEKCIKRICKIRSYNYNDMSFIEIVRNMTDWLKLNQANTTPLISGRP